MEVIEMGRGWLKEGEAPDAVLEEAVGQLAKADDKMAQGAWQLVGAEAFLAKAHADEALDLASQAMAVFKELDAPQCETAAAVAVASALLMKQDLDDAIAAVTRALDLCTQVKDMKGEGCMFLELSRAYLLQMKDPYVAARAALSAVQIFQELGEKEGVVASLSAAAEAHLLYDPEQALKVAKEAVAVCDEIGDYRTKASLQHTLAAAKTHIATVQQAEVAGSMSTRGDGYIKYKWPQVQQQRGEPALDPFQIEGYEPPSKNGKTQAKSVNFMRRSFKWTAGKHATDAAWYRQELHYQPPKFVEE